MAEYIDRKKLLEDISSAVVFTVRPDRPSAELRGANKIMDRIMVAPVADVVEVRHGKWIKTYPDNRLDGDYYCSNCYAGVDIATGEETPIDRELYYCPNCGARMDGATDTNVGGKLKEGAEE